MNKKSEFLGTDSIGPLIVKMSIPAVVGMIVMTLYNIVDSIFIGHKVGSLGLGAVGIVFPLMMLVVSISVGIGMGTSSIISRALGEKKHEFAEKVFENFITFIILFSIIFTVLGVFFIDQILYLLGASGNIFPYAKEYLLPIMLGISFQLLAMSLTNIVRSVGSAKTAMFSMLLGGILNILLDYYFLFVKDYGIAGAAYATVISQFVSFIFLIFYFSSKNSVLKFRRFQLDTKVLKTIFTIGMPSFIRQSLMSITGIFVNHIILIFGGELAIAAYGIIFRILMLLVMPAMGIMQGTQPIIGYNYGAKKFDRVKKTLVLSISSSTIIITLTFVLVLIFPELFIKMFTKEIPLIDFTRTALLITLFGIPLLGFQFMVQGYFQAVGKAREAFTLSLLRQVICFIPLIFILPHFIGIAGIWYSYPISDFVSSVVTFLMVRKEFLSL